MENAWRIPAILNEKLKNSCALKSFFAKIPDHCYTVMMCEVIHSLCTGNDLSFEMQMSIEKRHAYLHISETQFDVFVSLFAESAKDAGLNDNDVSDLRMRLNKLRGLFSFDNADFKLQLDEMLNQTLTFINQHSGYEYQSTCIRDALEHLNAKK